MKKVILFSLIMLVFSGCVEKYQANSLSVKNNNIATLKFEHDTNFPWVPGQGVYHYSLLNKPLKCSDVLEARKELNYDGQIIESGKYFSIYSLYLGPYFYGKFEYQCNARIKFLPKKGKSYLLKVSHEQPSCKVTLLEDLGQGKYVNVPFTKEPLCTE